MIEAYDHTAQNFVDALNMKLMPQLGYVFRNDRWEWPNRMTGFWEAHDQWNEPYVSTGERIEEKQDKKIAPGLAPWG